MNAKTRITLGLGCLLFSVLLVAVALGLAPDQRAAVMDGRAALCEAIALNSSALIGRRDMKSLQIALQGIVDRNPEILSAAVRRANGTIAMEVGDHAAHWTDLGTDQSIESQVQVPLRVGDRKWGSVELRFQPLTQGGLMGLLGSPWFRFVGFVTAATLLAYLVYLGKVLEQLDPSKVVPGRVRNALNTLAEGLIILDRSGRIVLANESFARLVGRPPDKLIGVNASRLPWIRSAPDGASEVEPWLLALQQERPLANVAMRLRASDGSEKTFAANCSPVLGHQGKYSGVLASFDDVTQLEEHKRDLRKSKEEAELANRAKSDFLARMSHEIRTPMNAILGFTDVLRRGLDCDPAERQEYLNTIHSSGQHLLNLINDILDLSKVEAGKLNLEFIATSPVQVVSEVVSVLRVRAQEKGISLEKVVQSAIPETILTDPVRLRQMLMNLVANAIKFTDTGSVNVALRFEASPNNPRLIIDVIDTGIGIAREAIAKIFDPFSQADTSITRRFGGTGLGLTICRRFADALGARLSVASEPGVGSTFTLSLDPGPLENVRMVEPHIAAEVSYGEAAQDKRSARLTGMRILVADDGIENRKLLSLVLGRAGARVNTAQNGEDAVMLATEHLFDIILMDVEMPVMDGFTAVQTLRQTGVDTPILALTAHAMKGDEQKCRAAGFSGYVPKPIDLDQLVSTLAEAYQAQSSPANLGGLESQGAGSEVAAAAEIIQGELPAGEKLVSTLPADDAEFREILREFVERLEEQLAAISAAALAGDADELGRLAHWLKGSGGTAGFDAFTAPARELERLAKQKNLQQVPAVLARLQALASRIVIEEPETTANVS